MYDKSLTGSTNSLLLNAFAPSQTHTHTAHTSLRNYIPSIVKQNYSTQSSFRSEQSESSACNAFSNVTLERNRHDAWRMAHSENHTQHLICIICIYFRSYRFCIRLSLVWRRDIRPAETIFIYFINGLTPGIEYADSDTFNTISFSTFYSDNWHARVGVRSLGSLAHFSLARALTATNDIACKRIVGVESDKKGHIAIYAISSRCCSHERKRNRESISKWIKLCILIRVVDLCAPLAAQVLSIKWKYKTIFCVLSFARRSN